MLATPDAWGTEASELDRLAMPMLPRAQGEGRIQEGAAGRAGEKRRNPGTEVESLEDRI